MVTEELKQLRKKTLYYNRMPKSAHNSRSSNCRKLTVDRHWWTSQWLLHWVVYTSCQYFATSNSTRPACPIWACTSATRRHCSRSLKLMVPDRAYKQIEPTTDLYADGACLHARSFFRRWNLTNYKIFEITFLTQETNFWTFNRVLYKKSINFRLYESINSRIICI